MVPRSHAAAVPRCHGTAVPRSHARVLLLAVVGHALGVTGQGLNKAPSASPLLAVASLP